MVHQRTIMFKRLNEDHGSYFDSLVDAINTKDLNKLKKILRNKKLELVGSQNLNVLHLAARWADVEVLQTLLGDPRVLHLLDRQMYNGDTPLLAAARYGNVNAVRVFLDHGANMYDKKTDSENTVLHFAARLPDCELMNVLLSRSPSSRFLATVNAAGETALEVALKAHSPSFQILLQAGVDCLRPNIYTGRTILHTSVAYNQCGVVQELITSGRTRKLVDLIDHRGDTAFMLAVRVGCFTCVKTLIHFLKPGLEINSLSEESILHLTVHINNDEILKYLLMFSNERLINHRDKEGLTPLLLAIETNRDRCLERLIRTHNIFIKNKKTQETVLHAAVRVGNRTALSLLLHVNHQATSWCFSQQNSEGSTPFWAAVESGNAHFVVECLKGGWVNADETNGKGDSATFVAAAFGHVKLLKVLLLSPRYYKFIKEHERDKDLKDQKLIRNAEICCDIYSSDIFILANKTRKNKLHSWIPKTFLSVNQVDKRNIFHACALGGNINCLDFVYVYVASFKFDLSLFDSTDEYGNTPLLLATKNLFGGPDCVYFFLSNRANIAHFNTRGDFVLKSLLLNTEDSTHLLETVFDESLGDHADNETGENNFSIFRPLNEPVTKVVKLCYDTIEGPSRTQILQHTLFNLYINSILVDVNYFFLIRFIFSFMLTAILLLYLLLPFSWWSGRINEVLFLQITKFVLIILSISCALLSVPLLFQEYMNLVGIFTDIFMLLPCFSVILLTQFPYGSQFTFDLAALTVLISFLSLMMYFTTIFKDLSNQIAMLTNVIHGVLIYFRIVFLILLPFSLVFFCIFYDSTFFFDTPFKSFIYTSFVLLQGDTLESYKHFESKHILSSESLWNSSNVSNMTKETLTIQNAVLDMLDFFFESLFLICFIITTILGLLNMLVGLAVRDGKTLAADGEVFRRRLQIHWLNNLERFTNNYFYKMIRHTPLVIVFGIVPSKRPKFRSTHEKL